MKINSVIAARSSVRSYSADPVEAQAVTCCLEAARLAPSACNAQPWHFVVVSDPETRDELASLSLAPGGVMNRFVAEAPVIVAVVAERPNISSQIGAALKKKPFYLIDIGIAAEHFCLQATELGLGTCMIGWFAERKVKRLLGIPGSRRPVLLITLGYPAAAPHQTSPAGESGSASRAPSRADTPKKRKPLSTITSGERYGRSWPEGGR